MSLQAEVATFGDVSSDGSSDSNGSCSRSFGSSERSAVSPGAGFRCPPTGFNVTAHVIRRAFISAMRISDMWSPSALLTTDRIIHGHLDGKRFREPEGSGV